MKKKIVSCLLVAVMCTLIGSVAYADESGSVYRADNIKSHGTLQYEQAGADNNVLIASQDLNYLADEIDELEDSYKRTATDSLAVIGQTPVSTVWSDICSAIEHSQDVSTGTTADNLSKDKGAWVNGEYITGNGADNDEFYRKGYADGMASVNTDATIEYIYHHHSAACNPRTCTYTTIMTNVRDFQGNYGTSSDIADFYENHSSCGLGMVIHTAAYIPNYQSQTHTHTTYSCGKSEGQIEGATIIWN